MKLSILALLLVATAPGSIQAFGVTSSRPSFIKIHAKTALQAAGAAEEHEALLEKLSKDWKKLEDDLQNVEYDKDEMAAADVAEAMLEKALEMTAASRYVEFDHETDAELKLKKAMAEQEETEASLKIEHDNAVGAEVEAAMLETYDNEYEDNERLREMSHLHAAHQVEHDLDKVLYRAQKAAAMAKKEFYDAEQNLAQLEQNEEELKVSLQELRTLKRTMAVANWKKESDPNDEEFQNLYWNSSI